MHTPWKVGSDLFGAKHVFDSGGDRLTNDRMCDTEGWEDKARLIAAAPDLLEALEAMVEDYQEAYGGDLDEEPSALKQARAAIAKAKAGKE